jgi:hypothetical protein
MILLILHPGDKRCTCASPPVRKIGAGGVNVSPILTPRCSISSKAGAWSYAGSFRTPIVQCKQRLPYRLSVSACSETATPLRQSVHLAHIELARSNIDRATAKAAGS